MIVFSKQDWKLKYESPLKFIHTTEYSRFVSIILSTRYIFLMLGKMSKLYMYCIELDPNYDSKSWNSNYCVRMYDTIRCEYKWAKSKVKWTGNLYFYDYPYGQLAWSSAQNIDTKKSKSLHWIEIGHFHSINSKM